jgi:hypothetical protein
LRPADRLDLGRLPWIADLLRKAGPVFGVPDIALNRGAKPPHEALTRFVVAIYKNQPALRADMKVILPVEPKISHEVTTGLMIMA